MVGLRRRARAVCRRGLAVVAAGMTACTYAGPADNLGSQRATWFSYLNGDDIRSVCEPGAPDRYRMIYNANFTDQVRGYDLVRLPDGGAILHQVVDRGIRFTAGEGIEPLRIGAPSHARTPLTAEETDSMLTALNDSGAFVPPPVGLRLFSKSHYWVVTGCRDGAYFLTAFRNPSPAFDAIRFDDLLYAHDRTGEPLPRGPLPNSVVGDSRCRDKDDGRPDPPVCFALTVGADGLQGL